jgi:alginate O-acetyltransferase complex protein AlgI
VTFCIVCASWVFFRADTLPQTWTYLKSLAGAAATTASANAIAATIYTPYHVLVFAICVVIVWAGPQTWNFTQKLTPARAGVCLGLLCMSILAMWTQTVNPFLYFQF